MNQTDEIGEPKERLRIRKIEVKGLCGLYDHTIELDSEERVTILHGPNGVGKTAILRLVHALCSGSLDSLCLVPFDSVLVDLGPTTSEVSGKLAVRSSKADEASSGRLLEIELKVAEQKWNGELVVGEPDYDPEPITWLRSVRKRLSSHLIETHRLQEWDFEGQPELVSSVLQNAEHLARRISDTMARFGRDSQALEQTYPQRLLKMGNGGSVFEGGEMRRRLAELDARREELKRLGLLERSESHPIDPAELDQLEPTEKKVLTLYVQDSEKKLDILADLAARIRLFLDFLNRKFRHKQIQIDREKGFVAVSESGQELNLDALSSGEQHELVLLHDLLFRVEPDTLVMIDEPEISLHLAWQRNFLPELLEIVKVAGFDALIATHSPFIVGDRSDLMVPLSDET